MLDKLIGFLLGLREAGKEISTKNASQLQSIHDTAAGMLGLDCGQEAMSEAQRIVHAKEAWRSYTETQQAVWEAIEEVVPGICGWIRDIWDDRVVYSAYGDGESALYQVGYAIDGQGKVTLAGTPVPVRSVTTYEPVPMGVEAPEEDDLSESDPPAQTTPAIPLVESSSTPLTESVRDDGTVPIKIISPGWGASAYYPTEVLKRDGPKLFTAGTHTYWNHPTITESVERPERDLSTLAGALATDARWIDAGPDGPGLYADTFVAEGYRGVVNDLAPHIGMSIIASGYADEGTIEGRAGKILTGFLFDEHAPPSVDYVTRPGAGGKVISLFEAARPAPQEQPSMGELDDLKQRLAALEAQNATLREAADTRTAEASRLREADTLRHVREIVGEELIREDLLPQTRTRLLAEAVKQPPMTGDVLDEAKLRERTQDLIRKEMAYLASATGSGRISGMGDSAPKVLTESDVQDQLAGVFGAIGMSESGAKLAARGRAI